MMEQPYAGMIPVTQYELNRLIQIARRAGVSERTDIVGPNDDQMITALQRRLADAQAIEASRAETGNTDSVHESAVPKGNAP